MSQRPKMQLHPFPPLVLANSKVLILGSFPSVKSREENFFYGHPQNRFWKVISDVFEKPIPISINEKKSLIEECGLALWDVIASCEITGSSDASIKNVVANDIAGLLGKSKIERVFVNGKTAYKYFLKFIQPQINIKGVCLPSTSPANAVYSLERLIEEWSVIK